MGLARTILIGAAAVRLFTACFPFEAYNEHLDGPYRLWAADTREQIHLSYDLGDGNSIGRIGATVFAVGWDARHLIVKRHPGGDRSVTQYYILERQKDSALADPSVSVTGPLDSMSFEIQRRSIGVAPELGFMHTVPDQE